jgi:hypothetical protein
MEKEKKDMDKPKKDKFGTKEYEVPTEKNMNRPKATSDRSRSLGEILGLGKGYPMKEAEERLKKIEARNAQRESGPFKKGGMVSSASKRADGVAKTGKTKGRFV